MSGFIIYEKLPSLNEVIAKNRTNRYAGAKYKKDIEDRIAEYIFDAKNKRLIVPSDDPCIINIIWHERTKKRDVDNIQSSQKFILDAMQKTGILQNDSRKYVRQIVHFVQDDKKDYVEVKIVACKKSMKVEDKHNEE